VYRRWLWPGLALPGVLWLVLLFVVPFYAVLAVAFGKVDPILFQPVPIWNPLAWNVGWLGEVLSRLAPGGIWFDVGVRTIVYVLVSLALCLLIGYPVAYYAARHAGRWKGLILILIILPLWKTGILGGAVLITLPMFGDYYTPNIVSGSPKTSMIGNQIDLYFHGGPQPTIGAALTIVIAAFLTVLMLYYLRSIHRAQSEGGTVGAL